VALIERSFPSGLADQIFLSILSVGCVSHDNSWILACLIRYSNYLDTRRGSSGHEEPLEVNANAAFVGSPLHGGASCLVG
jgi:hypothetical protein